MTAYWIMVFVFMSPNGLVYQEYTGMNSVPFSSYDQCIDAGVAFAKELTDQALIVDGQFDGNCYLVTEPEGSS